MNVIARPWPLYLRLALIATATGIAGWLVWALGASVVGETGDAQWRDTIPMVGSALMHTCSLLYMLVAVLVIVNCLGNRTFTLTHGIVLLVAACVTLAAGIDGAYPR